MFPDVKVYPITDVRISGLSHAEQVTRLIEGGAKLIQLREKHLPPSEFFVQAAAAIKVAKAKGAQIIINDRVDVALALGAEGVLLGQDDLPPEAARRLLGNEALIGFSAHNLTQALNAPRDTISYLAIGPIFWTSSKAKPDPVLGLAELRRVREVIGELPLVAIGGVTLDNIKSTIDAGATTAAVISAILANPTEITQKTRRLIWATD